MTSPSKLRMLHTLFGIYAAHSLDVGGADAGAARLAWASATIGHQVQSFNALTDTDADELIDALKRLTRQPIHERERWTRMRDRHAARAFGTHGRRSRRSNDEVMASAGDLAAIDQMWQRLGWTREQFDAWIAGPSSPLGNHATVTLRSLRQANRVRWALKALLKKAGLWRSERNPEAG